MLAERPGRGERCAAPSHVALLPRQPHATSFGRRAAQESSGPRSRSSVDSVPARRRWRPCSRWPASPAAPKRRADSGQTRDALGSARPRARPPDPLSQLPSPGVGGSVVATRRFHSNHFHASPAGGGACGILPAPRLRRRPAHRSAPLALHLGAQPHSAPTPLPASSAWPAQRRGASPRLPAPLRRTPRPPLLPRRAVLSDRRGCARLPRRRTRSAPA
jgi:hypothetical protein